MENCKDPTYTKPIVLRPYPGSQAEVFSVKEFNELKAAFDAEVEKTTVMQREITEIKANPDVVDIVATKADLDSYDKSTLTDKDIVKVLVDESQKGGMSYYRYSTGTNEFTLIGTLYKATQETLDGDKGTAVIANDTTGGILKFTTNDGKQSGIAVNDGEQDIYAQLYSKTTKDNNGARISLNPTGAYYTKSDSVEFTDDDEIVTKKQLDELKAQLGEIEATLKKLNTGEGVV